MGPSRMSTTAPMFPAIPEMGLRFPPEFEAARGLDNTMGTSEAARLLDGCRVLLQPRIQPRCGVNCSCGGMERPIDLSVNTTRNEPETSNETNPLNGLIHLTREIGNEGEIGEAETAGEVAEEHVDVADEGDDRI